MKRSFGAMLAGVVVLAAALTGCGSQDTGSEVTLRISDGWSAKHPIGASATQPFLAYLAEHGSAVGLKVDYYAVGQLGKPKDALPLLRTGALDIAPVVPAYNANEVPLASVSELPGLVPDACTGIEALMPMVEPGGLLYQTQFSKQSVRPIWGVMIPGYEVFTSEKRVTAPDSLIGQLIRSPGGIVDRLTRQLGAAPVQMAAPDLYEAVARQTVSGAILSQLSVTSYSLQEVLRYATRGANLTTTTIVFSISDKAWDRLNDAQRKVLQEASRIATTGGCKGLTEADAKATAKVRAAGVEMTEISGPIKDAWDATLRPVRDNWVRDLESVNLPARAVLDDFQKRLTEAAR